jgi:hypothetical protein
VKMTSPEMDMVDMALLKRVVVVAGNQRADQ